MINSPIFSAVGLPDKLDSDEAMASIAVAKDDPPQGTGEITK
jgi:hypothetical protein